jgi:alanyl-tRNA synthetase
MRFDFTNPEPVAGETLRAIEAEVNAFVRGSLPVVVMEMSLEEAKATGAIAPFGEKYGARVRVVRMGGVGDWNSDEEKELVFPVSVEFCGGTHVANTGELGLFVITGESSVASGIRRIEGKAGRAAFEFIKAQRGIVDDLSRRLSAKPEALAERLESMQDEIKSLRRQVEEARAEKARAQMTQAAGDAREIKGVKLIAQQMPGAGPNELAQAWDEIKNRSGAATVGVFLSVVDGKVNIVVGCTDDIAPSRVKAGDILKAIGEIVGGKGGGKPQLARGGGADPSKIGEALGKTPGIIESLLS